MTTHPAILFAFSGFGAALLFQGCSSGPVPIGDTGSSIFALSTSQFSSHVQLEVGANAMATHGSGCPLATGVQVAKGDVVKILATGTIQVNGTGFKGPYDAEGIFGWVGGTPYAFENQTPFALYACVNEQVTRLGADWVYTAQDSGSLQLAINGCTGCSVGGAFTADIYTQPDVKIATQPTVLDNTRLSTASLAVDSAAGWVDSGIGLLRGQKIFVDASGTITTTGLLPGSYGPDGNSQFWGGTSFLLPSRPAYRLFARVGQSIVDVGAHGVFLSPAAGELEFAVNARNDATGSFDVSLGLGVVPARDLTQDIIATFKQHDTEVVDAQGGWSKTTIQVEAGDPIFAQATGTVVDTSSIGLGGTFDPNGGGAYAGNLGYYPVPNYPVEALLGQLGSEVLYVSEQSVVFAPTAGQLQLIINSDKTTTGSYTATLAAP